MVLACILIAYLKILPIPNFLKSAIIVVAALLYLWAICKLIHNSRKKNQKLQIKAWAISLYLFLSTCLMVPYMEFIPHTLPVESVAVVDSTAHTQEYFYPYSVHAEPEDVGGLNRQIKYLSEETWDTLRDADFENYTYVVTYGGSLPAELSYSRWDSVWLPIYTPQRHYEISAEQMLPTSTDKVYIWRTPFLCYEFD